MKFKDIDSFSITECCEYLKINRQDLPDIVEKLNVTSKQEELFLQRLKTLLVEDRMFFQNCKTVSEYENYLSVWVDGVWREQAQKEIARLNAESEEIDYYNKNKGSISGCKAYLKKYPNGRFVSEIKSTHNRKIRKRKIRNISIFIIITIFIAIFWLFKDKHAPHLDLTVNNMSNMNEPYYDSIDSIRVDIFSCVDYGKPQDQYSEDKLLFSLQNKYDEVEKERGDDGFVFYHCKIGEKYEILDSMANVLIPKIDFHVSYYERYGIFAGQEDGIWVIYSKSGDMVIPATRGYTGWYTERVDDKRFYHVVSREDGTQGVCDKDGNVIIEPAAYDDVGYISAADDDDIDISSFYYRQRHGSENVLCYIYLDETNFPQHYPRPITHHLYISDRFYVKEDKRWIESMQRHSVLVYDDYIIVDLFIYHYWGTIDEKKYFKRGGEYFYFDVDGNLFWKTEEFWRIYQKDKT